MKHIFKFKLKKCPECSSSKIAEIHFGLPYFTEQFQKDVESGKIILGGCCRSEDEDPAWQCVDCGIEIYKEAIN